MQTSPKVKPEIFSDMVGRIARYEIEIMVIQALQESRLRYTDLREKINSCCQGLGLKKPSNDAFYSRLANLCHKDVIVKEKVKYEGTHYSLKSNHHVIYLERLLSLHKLCVYVYPFEVYFKKVYSSIHS
jgi:hypothetical protein